MKLKTYFASSVEEAMVQALSDLGPDALILNSRRTPPEFRQHGEYEVVFAVDGKPDLATGNSTAPLNRTFRTPAKSTPSSAASAATPTLPSKAAPTQLPPMEKPVFATVPPTAPARPPAPEPAAADELQTGAVRRLQTELERLTGEVESLARLLRRSSGGSQPTASNDEERDLIGMLAESGFTTAFASSAIESTPAGSGSLRFRLLHALVARVKSSSQLGRAGSERKIVAFAGPAGAGKSSLIAKLAVRFGAAARRPCRILSLDSDRIGAAEPLRLIAGVLSVPFELIDAARLPASLATATRSELLFLDLSGVPLRDSQAAAALSAALGRARTGSGSGLDVDVHLTLPANINSRDLARMSRDAAILAPTHLAFSHLDETEQVGPMLELSAVTGLPMSFLSTGPAIPEDFEIANPAQLVRRAFLPAGAAAIPGAVRTAQPSAARTPGGMAKQASA